MSQSQIIQGGDKVLAHQYNDLRNDVLDPSLGHKHDGVGGAILTDYIRVDGTHPFVNNQSMGGYRLIDVADPVNLQDVVTKQYLETHGTSTLYKDACRVATTTGYSNLATGAPDSVDSILLIQGDRILVKDQVDASENGIYIVNTVGTGSNGTWTRAQDADEDSEVKSGMRTFVQGGMQNANTTWVLTTPDPITLGTTALSFKEATDGLLRAENNLGDVLDPAIARQNLGLEIGVDVQAWSANLDGFATKTPPSGEVVGTTDTQILSNKTLVSPIIGDLDGFFDNSGNEILILDTVTLPVNYLKLINAGTGSAVGIEAAGDDVNIDINLIPKGSGNVTIGGQAIYYQGGPIIAITDGGTGADNTFDARRNLGLEIGVDVQAWDTNLDQLAALDPTSNFFIVGASTHWETQSATSVRATIGAAPESHTHNDADLSGIIHDAIKIQGQDVSNTIPLDGDILQFDTNCAACPGWVPVPASSIAGAMYLNDLNDVVITNVVTDEVLAWDGTQWVNTALVHDAVKLQGTDISGTLLPSANDLLQWNGTVWVAVPASSVAGAMYLNDLSDVDTTGVVTGEVLAWNGTQWVDTTLIHDAEKLQGTDIASTLLPNIDDILQWNGTNWIAASSSGIGVTDHGLLSGLTDDDHPQYVENNPSNNKPNRITIGSSAPSGPVDGDLWIDTLAADVIHDAEKLRGTPIAAALSPSAGEYLKYDGTEWIASGPRIFVAAIEPDPNTVILSPNDIWVQI